MLKCYRAEKIFQKALQKNTVIFEVRTKDFQDILDVYKTIEKQCGHLYGFIHNDITYKGTLNVYSKDEMPNLTRLNIFKVPSMSNKDLIREVSVLIDKNDIDNDSQFEPLQQNVKRMDIWTYGHIAAKYRTKTFNEQLEEYNEKSQKLNQKRKDSLNTIDQNEKNNIFEDISKSKVTEDEVSMEASDCEYENLMETNIEKIDHIQPNNVFKRRNTQASKYSTLREVILIASIRLKTPSCGLCKALPRIFYSQLL
ncbi:unnamed protein product [Cunninghamella blakesleeana]